ncbi:MAG: hypothetical protein VR71_20735 [Roseovarius sp. BRH_c41]|nr:MAG: hypothetical protein VR71_20735 [Roseovarius sp. BRH_c41]
MGLVWIGHGIKLWANGAPATEIMYDKEGSLTNLAALDTEADKTYFLSSEALCSYDYMLEAISKKFEIDHIVMTVRMPVPMILSEYCWSGWLYRAPRQIYLDGRLESMTRTIERLREFGPVVVCPIEPSKFPSRFCDAIAPTAPSDIEEIAKDAGDVNVSIPPCLAEALNEAITALNMEPVPGPMRRYFVNAAMENKGPEEFRSYMPDAFHSVLNNADFVEAEIEKYRQMLEGAGLSNATAREALELSKDRLTELAKLPVADPSIRTHLREHAGFILDKVRASHPEAIPA